MNEPLESMQSMWERQMGKYENPTPPPFERAIMIDPPSKDDECNQGFGEILKEIADDLGKLMRKDKSFRQFIWGLVGSFGLVGAVAMAKHVWIPIIFGI